MCSLLSPNLAMEEPSVENSSIPNQFLSAPRDSVGIQMTNDKACPEVDLLCKTKKGEQKVSNQILEKKVGISRKEEKS
jgi:hypothetical protein